MWPKSVLGLLVAFYLGVCATSAIAETWKRVQPEGIQFLDFAEAGPDLFAGTGSDGIYRSSDRGRSWAKVPSCFSGSFNSVPSIHASPGLLAASFEGGGVCVSLDEGKSWRPALDGLPQQPFLYTIARLGDTIFAGGTGVYGGSTLFKSSVQDFRWTRADSGLPAGVRTVQRILAIRDSVLVAGISSTRLPSAGSVFVSRDRGASWLPTLVPFPYAVYHMVYSADVLILATEHGIFRSEDLGEHWSAPSGDPPREEFYSLAASGKELYAGSGHGGLYVSKDYGISWMSISQGLPSPHPIIEAIWLGEGLLIASFGPGEGGWFKESGVSSVRSREYRFELASRTLKFDLLGRANGKFGRPDLERKKSLRSFRK